MASQVDPNTSAGVATSVPVQTYSREQFEKDLKFILRYPDSIKCNVKSFSLMADTALYLMQKEILKSGPARLNEPFHIDNRYEDFSLKQLALVISSNYPVTTLPRLLQAFKGEVARIELLLMEQFPLDEETVLKFICYSQYDLSDNLCNTIGLCLETSSEILGLYGYERNVEILKKAEKIIKDQLTRIHILSSRYYTIRRNLISEIEEILKLFTLNSVVTDSASTADI